MGLQARLMSQALRKMSGNASKAGCTLMFLNQIRYKVFYISFQLTVHFHRIPPLDKSHVF
jgi:RecA/RadA recombinase